MAQIIDMKGKVALVTGASSGLGRSTAIRLAEAGADLALVARTEEELIITAAAAEKFGVKTFIQVADLTDPDACTTVVDAAVEHFGHLDALCNIAGIVLMDHSHKMKRDQYEKLMAINLHAPWYLSQAAIPYLLETNGAIVNVASTSAFFGASYAAAYCASKAALINMTKAMAMEYSKKPIRINAVAPGNMKTKIHDAIRLPKDIDVDLLMRYAGMRGSVEVEDAAEQIAMLASPAGRGYHGSCITIDAGVTAG